MTKLSSEEVQKLAKLARLRLTGEEVVSFQSEIEKILEYINMISKIDTEGLAPTYQVDSSHGVTRPDLVVDYGATQADLMKNAPGSEGDYLKVKRMIG